MSTFFEPNQTLLTFFIIKTFFFIELIGCLALIRVFTSSRASRHAALGALLLAAVGIAAKYVPPLAGITAPEILRIASQITNLGIFKSQSGMALPICVSLLFALSWCLEGRRWWGLDALHALAAAGFFSLWIYTLQ